MNFPISSGAVPEASRVNPEHAGPSENKAGLPEPAQPDWITVKDAQEYFRLLGLPRSVEAIRKYCRQGKLKAEVIAGPKGDQHMINRSSVDTFVAEQLKVLEAASRSIPVRDGTTRMIPVHSVTSRVEPAHPGTQESVNSDTELGELKSKIERLESEKRDLEIDKEVRTRMNDVLEKNNNRLLEQVKQVSHEAQEWSRKFGQLEERVQHLQLTSPKGSTEKSDTADDGGTEETVNLGDEREMVNDGINHPAKPEGGTIYFEASPRSSSCGYQQPPTGSVGV